MSERDGIGQFANESVIVNRSSTVLRSRKLKNIHGMGGFFGENNFQSGVRIMSRP